MLQELAGELCASQVQVVIGVALFLLKLKIAGHAKFYAESPTLDGMEIANFEVWLK